MQVIPAIDVLDGRVVRLVQGDFAPQSDFGNDPLGIADGYRRCGATRLHLVNLSAARDGDSDGSLPEIARPALSNHRGASRRRNPRLAGRRPSP